MAGRDDIERLDRELIELIARRSEEYIRILKSRKEGNTFAAEDRSRLDTLIEECNHGPLPNDIVKKIYVDILSGSMSAVAPVTVAFLGPEGTFTAIAVRELFGESITPLPQRTIQDVFQQEKLALPNTASCRSRTARRAR
jgi:chorismate mutase